jgi:hypothetical protein
MAMTEISRRSSRGNGDRRSGGERDQTFHQESPYAFEMAPETLAFENEREVTKILRVGYLTL